MYATDQERQRLKGPVWVDETEIRRFNREHDQLEWREEVSDRLDRTFKQIRAEADLDTSSCRCKTS